MQNARPAFGGQAQSLFCGFDLTEVVRFCVCKMPAPLSAGKRKLL